MRGVDQFIAILNMLVAPKVFDQQPDRRAFWMPEHQSGADFILTQPIYDPPVARSLISRVQEELGSFKPKVLIGILPLTSARHASFLRHEVPGIHIPEDTYQRMVTAGENAAQTGVEIGKELVEQIQGFAQGIFIMPAFNRFDLAAQIIEHARRA